MKSRFTPQRAVGASMQQVLSSLKTIAEEHRQLRRDTFKTTVDTLDALRDPRRSVALAATAIVVNPLPKTLPNPVASAPATFNPLTVRLYETADIADPVFGDPRTAPALTEAPKAKKSTAAALERIKGQPSIDLQDVKTIMRGMWAVNGYPDGVVRLAALKDVPHASYWAKAALRSVSDDLSPAAHRALDAYDWDELGPADMAPELWQDPAFVLRMIEDYPQGAKYIPSKHINLELVQYLADVSPDSLQYLQEIDDKPTVDYLLAEHPRVVYEAVSLAQLEHLWRNPPRMAKAVTKAPMLLDVAPEKLLSNRAFLEPLALHNDEVLNFAPWALRNDVNWIESLMAKGGGVYFKYLDAGIQRDNPDLWAQAIEDYPLAVGLASLDMIQAHKDEVRAALLKDERGFFNLPQSVQFTLPDLAADVARNHHNAYLRLPSAVQKIPEVRIAGLAGAPKRLAALATEQRDPHMLAKVGRLNPPVLRVLSEAERTQIFAVDPGLETEYLDWMKTLETLDIDFPERFGALEKLQEIVHNRLHPRATTDTRPKAIIIFPKTDYNHAFERTSTGILAPHFRQEYYEVGTETDLYALLDRLAADDEEALLVEIGGHGSQTSLSLGDTTKTVDFDEAHLDLSDADEIGDRVDKILARGGHFFLKSCQTGKGREKEDNLLNMLMAPIDDATGQAPVISTNNLVRLDRDGHYKDAGYFGGYDVTYTVKTGPI